MPARLSVIRVVALLAMPLLLACGYVLTQRWVRAEFVRAHEASIADARASLERREQERRTGMPERRPETAISGRKPSLSEEFEKHVRDGTISRDFVVGAHLRINIAPKVVPISFGVAFGLWAAAVMGLFVKRRVHSPVSASVVPAGRSAPARRIGRFAFAHVLGLVLCMLGVVGAALVCADLNAYWYRPGALLPEGEWARLASIRHAVATGLPATFAVMALALGVPLVLRGGRTQPFLRLSRARALPLVVAACGVGWIVFSFASLAMYDARWRNQTLIGGVDPYRPGYFETQIGSAGLTQLGLPLGVGLLVVGIGASFVAPILLRRRPGFLSGATECVDCAQPLLEGQATCPECGCGHGAAHPS